MRNPIFPALAACLALMSCTRSAAPQDKLLANEAKISGIIAYADGPFGIREEGVPNGFQSAGWTVDSATYFPTGSALAATWSEELAYRYGTGMGKEARLRFAVEPVPADKANQAITSQPESQAIARAVAEKSIVLLKNEGILPVKAGVKKIAVIGQNAVLKTQSGGVGAGVKALYEITPLQGIQARESRTLTLEIPVEDLRYWNEAKGGWDMEHGKLQLLLGAASDDIRQTTEVNI